MPASFRRMRALVYIYADESCLGNQWRDRDSPGGAAALFEQWRNGSWERRDLWLSEAASTNNRMALLGAAAALRVLKRPCRVVFTSDSQYLVKGRREWVPSWVARGWRRRTGPVENAPLWQALLDAERRHRVDWRWVRGHAGHPQNEYSNELAIRAAREQISSGAAVASGFLAWLERERERDRYMDFFEHAPPGDDSFNPVASPGD